MEERLMVLDVRNLRAGFAGTGGSVTVVDDISFRIDAGQALGLVGESGCGKSITALSIMRLLPQPGGRIFGGEILFEQQDLLQLPAADMRKLRGNRLAMIFQEPMTALNPVYKVGHQMREVWQLHRPELSRHDCDRLAIKALAEVGIPAPDQRLQEYPHQLSGGMRQRVMIAMALALQPALLIADEPTTALDVTIQAQILGLIRELQQRHGTAVLLITHDLGVIAETCDHVAVMYAGQLVESAPVAALYRSPSHPYTRGLLGAIPRLDRQPKELLAAIPGTVPAVEQFGAGCRFANRCGQVRDACRSGRMPLEVAGDRHRVACPFWREGAQ